MPTASTDYDVLVVGSGFGGSVTALRLTEKGYRVGVLETGRRWTDQDFADQGQRDLFWAPRLGMFGPMRMSQLGEVSLFSAVGVGGGSLIYANTLYEPHDAFYDDPAWAGITDWRAELAPYYDQARRMLGVTTNPRLWPSDELLREVADDLGVGDTFQATDVGVLFGDEGEAVADPFFGGAGPERRACVHCAQVHQRLPDRRQEHAAQELPAPRRGGRRARCTSSPRSSTSSRAGSATWSRHAPRAAGPARARTFTADQVVVAAAARGTQQLLHRLKASGSLPRLSPRLGELSRSNSEAIVAAVAPRPADFDRGVAITSSFHPEPHTHVELCHSSDAQDSMSLMNVPLTDGGPHRVRRLLAELARHPVRHARGRRLKGSSKRTVSLLVMQSLDNSLTSYLHRGRLRTRQGDGAPNPSWIPAAHDIVRQVRRQDRRGADDAWPATWSASRPPRTTSAAR